jgi:D-aspartate ligase
MVDAVVLGETANTLSVARSLGRSGLEVIAASTIRALILAASRYVRRFEQLPDGTDADICAALMTLGDAGRRPFLMPTGDRFALLIAQFQEQLGERFCFVCPAYDTLLAIVDKTRLYTAAQSAGFRHPAFRIVAGVEDIEPAVADVPTPCYVKPALAHEWRQFKNSKLEQAESKESLRAILEDAVARGITVAPQEIIPGSDSEVYSLYTYIDGSGQALAWRTSRKLRQWPLRAGNACMRETVDLPEVVEIGHRLLSVTGYRGTAIVEFRRDARDGALVLIEINVRTGIGEECLAHSGLNTPMIAYRDAKWIPQPTPVAGPVLPTRWVMLETDFRAYRQLRREGQMTTRKWLSSLMSCNAYAYFALDDPRPSLRHLRHWLGGALGRRLSGHRSAPAQRSRYSA